MIGSSILLTLASAVSAIVTLATWVLIARIVMSWLNPNPSAGFLRTIVRAVYDVTDPVLDWLRVKLPFLVVGGIDLTPLVAFFGLSIFRNLAVGGLVQLAAAFGG